MKRLLIAVGLLVGMFNGLSYADRYPKSQAYSAVSTGTMICINVSTNPAVILSTGTGYNFVDGFYKNVSSTSIKGTYMGDRVQMEIFNDSGIDIYIGYNSSVSSMTGTPNYGRRIPTGSAWNHDCAVLEHWAVAGSSTGFSVVITQEK